MTPLFEIPAQHRVDLAFALDGRILATAENGELEIWDTKDRARLSNQSHPPTARPFVGGASRVGVAGADTVWVADASGTQRLVLPAVGDTRVVAISPDEPSVMLAYKDRVEVWRGREVGAPETFTFGGIVQNFEISPSGDVIAAIGLESLGSDQQVTRVWSTVSGQRLIAAADADDEDRQREIRDLLGKAIDEQAPDQPNGVRSSDGRWIARRAGMAVEIRGTDSDILRARLPFDRPPSRLEFLPDGKRIAVASGRKIELWEWQVDALREATCQLLRNNLRASGWQTSLDAARWHAQCPDQSATRARVR
jgi:hypothetical protein